VPEYGKVAKWAGLATDLKGRSGGMLLLAKDAVCSGRYGSAAHRGRERVRHVPSALDGYQGIVTSEV